MTTRNFVPRADGEGCIGVDDKRWQKITAKTVKAEDIVSPVIEAIRTELGEKAAQTAVAAISETLSNVKSTAEAAATKTYVDAQNESLRQMVAAIPFEIDENGDIMPKAGGV